ncbi:hypothetical protein [Streptomyces coelicoflavus]|uniref:hypothetical protein n=1 Tax=Streptomyces coelicoflavus TaxID=285562 RepID=UPI002E252E7C
MPGSVDSGLIEGRPAGWEPGRAPFAHVRRGRGRALLCDPYLALRRRASDRAEDAAEVPTLDELRRGGRFDYHTFDLVVPDAVISRAAWQARRSWLERVLAVD